MKTETIITAIVFFGAGFLAGYIYDAQKTSHLRQTEASVAAGTGLSQETPPDKVMGQSESPERTKTSLPEGHPPINAASLIRLLQDEAAQNPKDSGPPLKLANFFYDQRQFQQAVEWYQKALGLDPTNVEARTDLGTCYFNLGRTQDALREFNKSLEIDPKHEPTLFNLIVVNLEGSRDLAAAEQAWERLHKSNPNYPSLDRLRQSLDAARASGPSAAASGTQ